MAPVEPDLFVSNTRPIAITTAHAAGVTVLLSVVAVSFERMYGALPIAQKTRLKEGRRRNALWRQGTLALTSLVIMTYLGFQKRNYSYQTWAHQTQGKGSNSLWDEGWWRGWYASAEVDNGHQLGSWWADTDVYREQYEASGASSGAYWWAQQYNLGAVVFGVFLGLEGRLSTGFGYKR